MAHRRVRDVMTSDVTAAREDTPFKDLASLMAERGVTGLPVLDPAGRLSGVVSQIDLMRKEEYQEDPGAKPPPRWHHHADRVRASGLTARDVMTAPAVTIGPDATVVEAARALDRFHVKRLPVVGPDNHMEGIVSPRDLLRVFLRSDEDIRREILAEVFGAALGVNLPLVDVKVDEGVVTLSGEVERRSMTGVAVRLAQSVDGVVDVVDHLTFAADDRSLPKSASPDETASALSPPPTPGDDTDNLRRLV